MLGAEGQLPWVGGVCVEQAPHVLGTSVPCPAGHPPLFIILSLVCARPLRTRT